jgi:hypothetical protein
MWLFETGEVDIWVITDELWDITMIGSSQDELWDNTRALFGILDGGISIFRKVIIWKILR